MTEYWYCLKHNTVERDVGCPNKKRLGPYETQGEAARALETAAERNEQWESDPAWNDEAEDEDDPPGAW